MAGETERLVKQWIIPSAYGQEKIVIADAARMLSGRFFAPERLEEIVTALGEACLNALEHGNGLDRRLPVTVAMEVTEHECRFRVYDEGKGFRYAAPGDDGAAGVGGRLPRRNADGRGWGLLFISEFTDHVRVGRQSGKFFVEMRFRHQRQPRKGEK